MSSGSLTVLVIAVVVGAIAFIGPKEAMGRLYPGIEDFIGNIPGMGLLARAREGMINLTQQNADTALDRRRRKKRHIKVSRRNPCAGKEPSSDGMYVQTNKGEDTVCSGDKYTNNRGTHPMNAVNGGGPRFRQLREISDKRRQGMGVDFTPGKVLKKQLKKKNLKNQDFLGAANGHVIMPEVLPKRIGVQDLRGTPYIELDPDGFVGGGGLESSVSSYDTEYIGLTRM